MGQSHRFTWDGDFSLRGSDGHPYIHLLLRYKAGASLTITGSTAFYERQWSVDSPGDWEHEPFIGEFIAPATGQYTVGLGAHRVSGTGTLDVRGAPDNIRMAYLDDVKGS